MGDDWEPQRENILSFVICSFGGLRINAYSGFDQDAALGGHFHAVKLDLGISALDKDHRAFGCYFTAGHLEWAHFRGRTYAVNEGKISAT